jgi:hypothetical protein
MSVRLQLQTLDDRSLPSVAPAVLVNLEWLDTATQTYLQECGLSFVTDWGSVIAGAVDDMDQLPLPDAPGRGYEVLLDGNTLTEKPLRSSHVSGGVSEFFSDSPALADNQNQRPPIDWSNGKKIKENVKPWGTGPAGTVYEIVIGKDKSGKDIIIKYWLPNPSEGKIYWCHGFTFGGNPDKGTPPSVFSGDDVAKVLEVYYKKVADPTKIQNGDVGTFTSPGGIDHSFIIKKIVLKEGKIDWDKSIVETKNGMQPLREMSLQEVYDLYLEIAKRNFGPRTTISLDVFTRK